jgi:hypothetical protein
VDADNDGAGIGSDCRLVDCNDSDAAINATAAEVPADGIDQNCDGKELCFADGDGDGVGGNTLVLDVDADLSCATGSGVATVSGDCDDAASTCTTDCATDTDGDGIVDCRDLCIDVDGDDHGTAGGGAGCVTDGGSGGNTSCELDAACIADDCDDAASTCTTDCSTDADSDGFVDCRDLCVDADGDGYGTAKGAGCIRNGGSGGSTSCELDAACGAATDCDDSDEFSYPGAPETVADGIDQDCNGNDRCYADVDGDGAGQATEIDERDGDLDCTNDLGVTDNNSDCNDLDPMSHPGALDLPDDGIDQDCGSDDDVSASDSLGVFVDSSHASCATGTGTMESPVCSIGEGITAARNAGLRLVFIASGNYNESVSIDGQSLMGGYKTSPWLRNIDAYPTTIASTASAAVTIQDSSVEALEVLDGLIISGGSGTGNKVAVQSSGSDWRIHRCTIDGGTSDDAETVGISASNGNGILSDSVVSGGSAATVAHGIWVATSSLVVWRSTIDGGTAADGRAGGLTTAAGSTLYATANTLNGPTAADEAWALAMDSGTVLLVSNVIWGGSGTNAIGVTNSGAGVLLLHNTILAGSSDANASAVLLAGGSTTLLGNILEASGATGSYYGIVARAGSGELHDNQINGATCLVYGPLSGACLSTTTEVDNCTFPGCTSASGTRTGEPGFVEAGSGDYHLSTTSTLIDTLTWPATSYPLLADYDLDNRPSDAGGAALWDIGADERADRPADHLVISEVGRDFGGELAKSCDYVELYNPTASPISLAGMSVQRGTGAPGGLTVVTLESDATVAAYSFYLVADASWGKEADEGGCVPAPVPAADHRYSGLYINDDDVVMLVSNTEAVVNCHDSDIIDRVGFGDNACAEGRSPTKNPTDVSAIFRKADDLSTATTMGSGGSDELRGHSEDRDDNGRDFVRITSFQDPQNSSAAPQMP